MKNIVVFLKCSLFYRKIIIPEKERIRVIESMILIIILDKIMFKPIIIVFGAFFLIPYLDILAKFEILQDKKQDEIKTKKDCREQYRHIATLNLDIVKYY
jgi:hypothetical protein